jgi:hypothetical protein
MGSLFHQHLLDSTPLLEQELVLHLIGYQGVLFG